MSQKHHVLGTHTHSHLVSTLVKAVNSSMLAVSQGYVSKIHWAQNPWTLETHCLINTQRHHNREKISSHFSPLYFSTFSRVASSSFWVQTSASWAQLAKGHLEVVRGDYVTLTLCSYTVLSHHHHHSQTWLIAADWKDVLFVVGCFFSRTVYMLCSKQWDVFNYRKIFW